MKILALADLHADFWDEDGRDPLFGLEDEIADLSALILAGDITNKPKKRWTPALRRLGTLIDPGRIHVIPGNHDFYQFRIDGEDRLAGFASAAGVNYANCTSIVLEDVRFLCATLWTDFTLPPGRIANESFIPSRMNDFRLIRVAGDGYRRIRPGDVVSRHLAQKTWLTQELSRPFDGRTVVVTHHAPHPDALVPAPGNDLNLAAAYASDLTEMIETHAPDTWLFGHTHDAAELTVGQTTLRNISLGYPFQVPDPQTRIRALIQTF